MKKCRLMQRFLDFCISIMAIIFLLPLLIIIAIILKFTGEKEVFFLQDRVGKNGELFKIIKFATMFKNSPNIGTGTITIKNDPRILPMGLFLRKTKINELPQLFNILKGEMSVIGPRPLTKQNFHNYSIETQKNIAQVRPGLSGIGSIVFRKEEDFLDEVSIKNNFYTKLINYKGNLENWYIKNNDIYTYFSLIFLTIYIVLFPNSKIIWSFFKNVPKPPNELEKYLNYF